MKILYRLTFLFISFLAFNCSSDSDNETQNPNLVLVTCEGDIYLTSQDDINTFAQSGCQKIIGSLIIQDEWDGPDSVADIFNLLPLSNLKEVTGYINISSNNNIDNLNGLQNIERVGQSMVISGNQGLVEINGFNNLRSVNGEFLIEFHENLNRIDGFNNLIYNTDIEGGASGFGLTIQFNPGLIEISGFNQLQATTGWFAIRDNISLTTINGFSNLQEVGYDFYVVTNPLSDINAFSNLEHVGGNFSLWGTNLTDLSMFSSLSSVDARFWLDHNFNLISLNGLNNLITIGGAIRIGYFEGQANLENIEALSNLTSALSLHMQYNHSLTSLDGLENLINSIYEIDIYSNTNLTDFCAINGAVESALSLSGSVGIFGNGFDPNLDDFEIGNCSQ
jgi:hypothetical protein